MTMLISVILVLSILLNLFFIFYLRWLLKNYNFLSENVVSILESTENFSNHLSSLYELEMYYGDETLKNLLTHAKQVAEEIRLYRDVYTLTNEEIELKDYFNDTTEEEAEED